MVTSETPLVEFASKTVSANEEIIFKLTLPPDVTAYLNQIDIEFSAVAATTFLTVEIDGNAKLRKFTPVSTSVPLRFGGNLKFKGDRKKYPIVVKVADSATPTVTVVVTGLLEAREDE